MTLLVRRRKLREQDRGFTLLEVLIAITLVSLALVAVPQFVRSLPMMQFFRSTNELVEALREAHGCAVSTDKTVVVTIDTAKQTWTGIDNRVHVLEPPGSRVELQVQHVGPSVLNPIVFLPDGSATPIIIRVYEGRSGQLREITVNGASGEVRG